MYEELFNYCSMVSLTYQATLYTRVDLAAEVFQPFYVTRTVSWAKDTAWSWIVEPFNFGDKANLLFNEAPTTTILRVWERITERLRLITHITNGHSTEMTESLYDQFIHKGGKVPSFLLWDNYHKAHKDGTIPAGYKMFVLKTWNKGNEVPILVTPNKKLRFKDNGKFCIIVTKKWLVL